MRPIVVYDTNILISGMIWGGTPYGCIALAQAAIGPGMEVYSRYSKVMRISGEIVPIREVLKEINREITAYHEKETGELDPESQFCLTWLKQHGYMV